MICIHHIYNRDRHDDDDSYCIVESCWYAVNNKCFVNDCENSEWVILQDVHECIDVVESSTILDRGTFLEYYGGVTQDVLAGTNTTIVHEEAAHNSFYLENSLNIDSEQETMICKYGI